MKRKYILAASLSAGLLMASSLAQAVVSGDLLTNSKQTTAWQNCEGSSLIPDTVEDFEPSHLQDSGCAYRETPADPGLRYRMTCGVSSFKYSSITLAFLNDAGTILASETTEIYEDVDGTAYSATLTAPAGTTLAAVGIYGLKGSGFQDCTLLLENPVPQDGSIAGIAWFDSNGDAAFAQTENLIASTPVLLLRDGEVIEQTETGLEGEYYFGGLDLEACYQVQFIPADPTLGFTSEGGDNTGGTDGVTEEICLSAASPDTTDVNAGFVPVVPGMPPQDYAVCGNAWLAAGAAGDPLPAIKVVLINADSGERQDIMTTDTGAFSIPGLSAANYRLQFNAPAGFEFVPATTNSGDLTPGSSFVDANGLSPVFNLPGDANGGQDDICSIRYANAGLQPLELALEPTSTSNDKVTGFVGETLEVDVTDNDAPCSGGVLAIDLLGHNVPGTVTYDDANQVFVISDTTASGTYSIDYGLRGGCGSYATGVVIVNLEKVPEPPSPALPKAPSQCYASIGKATGLEPGVHIDVLELITDTAQPESVVRAEYRFYDAAGNLVYTGDSNAAPTRTVGAYRFTYWKKYAFPVEPIDIDFVAAVENGVESPLTPCVRRKVTPIALDTDHSGRVERITGEFNFDITGDGTRERLLHWFAPGDGILIYKDYGVEISGAHLLGDNGGRYTDGFARLAREDRNADGFVSGTELEPLAIWTDRNSNAVVDAGEVSSLESHAIKRLPVQHYKYSARATLHTGETMWMRDLWFGIVATKQASR